MRDTDRFMKTIRAAQGTASWSRAGGSTAASSQCPQSPVAARAWQELPRTSGEPREGFSPAPCREISLSRPATPVQTAPGVSAEMDFAEGVGFSQSGCRVCLPLQCPLALRGQRCPSRRSRGPMGHRRWPVPVPGGHRELCRKAGPGTRAPLTALRARSGGHGVTAVLLWGRAAGPRDPLGCLRGTYMRRCWLRLPPIPVPAWLPARQARGWVRGRG